MRSPIVLGLGVFIIVTAAEVLLSTTSSVPTTNTINAPTCKLAAMEGYRCETHEVTTEDHFILSVHRLSRAQGERDPDLLPVLLQHGVLDSSAGWVISGPQQSLAYILADQGYDVWMGNARGNVYSKFNRSLPPRDPRLWSWSWHEMGYYDLPAVIDYMLAQTGHQQIFYVGHSMGTTMFFVLCSMRPEYNSKVRYMAALAPVAFMKHTASPIRYLAPYSNNLEKVANFIGKGKFLPRTKFMDYFIKITCQKFGSKLCENCLFFWTGSDPDEFDQDLMPIIMGHSPSGTSARTLVHYAQGINTKYFQQFDYGAETNKLLYGDERPPQYNLTKITVPISLHFGDNDILTTKKDIFHLYWQLPKPVGLVRVNQPSFNHLDFQYGRHVKTLVYDKVLAFFKQFNDGSLNCNDVTSLDYTAELCESVTEAFNIAIKDKSAITKIMSSLKGFVTGKFLTNYKNKLLISKYKYDMESAYLWESFNPRI